MGRYYTLLLALCAAAATVSAQGVLTNGNSQFPACAQACPLLVQAAQACSATDVASQGAWVCFCQSAYLTNLRSSATGICDSTCTNPTDLQQVSTWYNTNCGSDFGASEHSGSGATTTTPAAGAGAAGGATPPEDESAPAAATSSTSPSSSAPPSSNGQNTLNGVSIGADAPGTWWSNHYKWIIMVIILAIAFPLIAWGAVWLKRRHERKQDQITTGFNEGITRRPHMTEKEMNGSTISVPLSAISVGPAAIHAAMSGSGSGSGTGLAHGFPPSGRSSPQRTREAYMPFGYGYMRSTSAASSRNVSGNFGGLDEISHSNSSIHPLARGVGEGGGNDWNNNGNDHAVTRGGGGGGGGGASGYEPQKGKMVLVREQSVDEESGRDENRNGHGNPHGNGHNGNGNGHGNGHGNRNGNSGWV